MGTYDYHGHWDKKTGHVAPMNFHSESELAYFNANYTLNYWIRLGGDPKKVIMGIPLYGQSFTLTNPNDNGLNAPAMGPYAYKGDQWTSFDDVSIVRRKAEMVKTMKLGGAMIWALDLDDFSNRCGCEHHPLLRTIDRVL